MTTPTNPPSPEQFDLANRYLELFPCTNQSSAGDACGACESCEIVGKILWPKDEEFPEPKVYSFTQMALISWDCDVDGTILGMDVTSLDAPEMWSECDEAPEFDGEDYDEWVQVMYRMTANIKHYEPFQNVPEGIGFTAI